MRARRRFGQHFLEPAWIDKVVEAIAPRTSDWFIEIGPGRGALTLALAPRVAALTAVEIDRELVAGLRPRLPPHARLVEGDFLQVPAAAWLPETPGDRVRVAGNLPYYISSPILARLCALARETGRLHDATLMLQLEVAERLAAPPGSKTCGVLSIQARLDAEASLLLELPPGAFRPRPEVRSAVVRLRFRPSPVAPGIGPTSMRWFVPVRTAAKDDSQRTEAAGSSPGALRARDPRGGRRRGHAAARDAGSGGARPPGRPARP